MLLKNIVHDYPKRVSLRRHVEGSKSVVYVQLVSTNSNKSFTSEESQL